jgi:hypothetical protein
MHRVFSKPVCMLSIILSADLRLGGHHLKQLSMAFCGHHAPAEGYAHRHRHVLHLQPRQTSDRQRRLWGWPLARLSPQLPSRDTSSSDEGKSVRLYRPGSGALGGQDHTGWRRPRRLRVRLDSSRTRLTRGLARETNKRLRFARCSGRFRAVRIILPPCQSRRIRRTRKMRRRHTNGAKGRSDRMLSPSAQVVDGLRLPYLEPI